MFKNPNKESLLIAFIMKPSQECTKQEIIDGIPLLEKAIHKNPQALIKIFSSDEYMPAIFVLDDLIDKLRKLNCADKLNKLFDDYLPEIMTSCVYNTDDLARLTKAMPKYADKISQAKFQSTKSLAI